MQEDYFPLLTERLSNYPVVFAYLFGSQATGKASRLSDIDLALYLNESTVKSERFEIRLDVTAELNSMMKNPVDVIILNDVPLSLRYEVLKHGKLILCKDREKRIETEITILSKYLDRRYYDKRRAEIILGQMSKRVLVP